MDSVTTFFWSDSGQDGQDEGLGSAQQNSEYSRLREDGEGNPVMDTSLALDTSASSTKSTASVGLQKLMTDALVEKLMKMAIPPSSELSATALATRMDALKGRPRLSVPVMSKNFIQTNARLSLPFMLVDEISNIFNWTNPPYTLCIMFLYTYMVLEPWPTITSMPILYILFGVMVPQYLYIHKPEKNNLLETNPTPAQGPPLRKAAILQPASELSQEFVVNLTDLQNHMLLYVKTYDFLSMLITSFAFFTHESISTVVFLVLLVISFTNMLFMDFFLLYFPVKPLLLFCGLGFFTIMHPNNRDRFFSAVLSERIKIRFKNFLQRYENNLDHYLNYVEAGEEKLVCIYEIQKFNAVDKEWVPIGYSPDDYTLFSQLQIKEESIENFCEPSMEEIKPPLEWQWQENSSWTLDLDPSKWVRDGFIQYVEIDPESKWVYDLDIVHERGRYRRRMWTNRCVRKREIGLQNEDQSTTLEEVVNPVRQKDTCVRGIYGVTKWSMSGNTPSTDLKKNVSTPVNAETMVAGQSPSAKYKNSKLSSMNQQTKSAIDEKKKVLPSKVIDTLNEVLNSTF